MMDFTGILGIVGLSKRADAGLDPLSQRLIDGDIRYESWPKSMQSLFKMTDGIKRVYNHFVPPIVSSLASRSYDYGESEVYSGNEVDSIFGQAALDTSTGKSVVDEIAAGGNRSTPRSTNSRVRWKPIAAAFGAAALLAWYMNRNRKRKRDGLAKTAGLYGWGARFEPHVNLLDDAMTATTPRNYRNVNNTFRELVDDDLKQLPSSTVDPSNFDFTWDRPFSFPGDGASPQKAEEGSKRNFGNAMEAMGQQLTGEGRYGIRRDTRLAPVTLIAASMLPNGTKYYSEEPSIGNMAYVFPAATGQYAQRVGMTDGQMEAAAKHGLDDVVIDALKSESARYPALKNMLSAYVNGGFGRSSQPENFGLERPFWDYSAQAMTPAGSNALHQAVSDIGAAGGYGGISPYQRYEKFNPYWPSTKKFEGVGLDVESLPLYAGNGDLRDYIYSLDDEGLSKLDQYYSWEENRPSFQGGQHGSREAYENFWNSRAEEAEQKNDHDRAERLRRVPLERPYGTPSIHNGLEGLGYGRNLPIDERRRMLYEFYNDRFADSALDSVRRDYKQSSGLVRDRNRTMGLLDDSDPNNHRGLSPEAIALARRFNGPYINAAYDAYQRYLDTEGKIYTTPYAGYDQTMPEKHYNELLRLVDAVGPSLFMPNTILGRDAVYHPIGGVVPNAQRMYTTYAPYFIEDPELVKKIDDASNGVITKGKEKIDTVAEGVE